MDHTASMSLEELINGRPTPAASLSVPSPAVHPPARSADPSLPSKINPISYAPVFDPVLGLDNLVSVWYLLYPDIELYPWQREELLRISGYPAGSTKAADQPRRHHFHTDPYQAIYPCANGSGKDKILIATTAIGLPLLYRNVSVVITSSSYGQLKNQTQRYISDAIKKLNAIAGVSIFDSVEFYHRCEERGAHINMFVTDEAGRAEGWHPLTPDGLLVMLLNEVKSIDEAILHAADRCHGWSHWLEVSSPGPRRGTFFQNWKGAVKYPALPVKGRYFGRKITADDCPHITADEQARIVNKHGELHYITQTSLRANFSEEETDVAVPLAFVESCESVKPIDAENVYGIGLDCAAGNDETTLIVRLGNRVVDRLFFTDADTRRAAVRIHTHLLPYFNSDYFFNYDDGGLGRTYGDQLTNLGWTLFKRNNQSAAFNTKEFLNLGAEMWHHTRELFERRQIIPPDDLELLSQLTTRPAKFSGNQGKKLLVSKVLLRAQGIKSPDRADAFVLAFFSYRPGRPAIESTPEPARPMSCEDLLAEMRRDPNYLNRILNGPKIHGTYTQQTNAY